MIVRLTDAEWEFGRAAGFARQGRRDAAGHGNAHGAEGGVSLHVWGALGELAYAKASGRYPSGLFVGIDEDDDVGGVQVRTRTGKKCDLYLWTTDDPEDVFAFLTYQGNQRFKLHAVVKAGQFMNERFFAPALSITPTFPRVDCYIIPQSALQAVEAAA